MIYLVIILAITCVYLVWSRQQMAKAVVHIANAAHTVRIAHIDFVDMVADYMDEKNDELNATQLRATNDQTRAQEETNWNEFLGNGRN